jgi:DNA-directed RNA polymerase subunit M/transcription elongation factor TFIIS
MFYCPTCSYICDISRGQKRREAAGGGKHKNSAEEAVEEVEEAVSSEEEESERKSRRRKQPVVVSDSDSDESEKDSSGDESDKEDLVRRRITADYADIVRMIMDNDAYDQIELIDYNEKDLLRHPDFQKLNSENREMVLGAVQHMLPEDSKRIKSSSSGVQGKLYYACNNCGYQTPLPPGTQVYRQNVVAPVETVSDLDVFRSMADDPTLPRTRNYTCPNKKCATHKDPNLLEMVTVRPDKLSYRNIFVCVECKHAWK